MKKILMWLGIALIVFYIITNPRDAADVAGSVGGGIAHAFRSIGTFLHDLAT